MNDVITIIKTTLGLDDSMAEEVLFLTLAVDAQVATKRYGYAKDNVMPAPMQVRLKDRAYVELLLEEARAVAEAGEIDVLVVEAVEEYLARDFSREPG